jgi:two-component system, sensor histidine kinase and response regulator
VAKVDALNLCFQPVPASGTGIPSSTAVGAAFTPNILSGTRVLLAEDNELNQEVARELLIDAGCQVDIVADGAQAVKAVQEHLREFRYDFVLMDCQMPHLDGFQASTRIRELERELARSSGLQRIPIIALTANAIAGDRQRCLASGMDGYVTKPVDPDLLIDTVRSLLKSRPMAANSLAATSSPITVVSPAVTPVAATPVALHSTNSPDPAPAVSPAVAPSTAAPANTTPAALPPESSKAATDPQSPIDAQSLLRRCRGKAPLAERLLTQFEQQLSDQTRALRESLDKGDCAALARLAHSVKGAAANMSAARVSDAASELERLGLASEVDAVADSLDQLNERIRQCLEFLPAALEQVRRPVPQETVDSRGSA